MGLPNFIKDFIAPEETDEVLELSEEEAESISAYEQPKNQSASSLANANIVLFEPRSYDEAGEIARHIKRKRACCINLHRMPSDYRCRMVDFLNGVVYGVDGSIKRISDNVILCSPKNLQVAGQIDLNNNQETE